MTESPLIQVGVSAESIIEARQSILDILDCKHEQDTIRAALKAFTSICQVKNTTISNCHLDYSGASSRYQVDNFGDDND